eukprot:scaffold67087_cov79-Phaeocystis_antarctica.AAC.3
MSSCAHSSCPAWQAKKSGVAPYRSLLSTLAPASRRNRTQSALPNRLAICSSVLLLGCISGAAYRELHIAFGVA